MTEGSNATWKCVDTLTTDKISTKDTVLAYIGDIPKYIPGVLFYFHLSNVDPHLREKIMNKQGRRVVSSALSWNLT